MTHSLLSPQQQTPCSAPPPATTAGMACALTRASSVMDRTTVKTTATRRTVRALSVGTALSQARRGETHRCPLPNSSTGDFCARFYPACCSLDNIVPPLSWVLRSLGNAVPTVLTLASFKCRPPYMRFSYGHLWLHYVPTELLCSGFPQCNVVESHVSRFPPLNFFCRMSSAE